MAKHTSQPRLKEGDRVEVTTDFFVGLQGQTGTVVKYNHNTYPDYRNVDVHIDGKSEKSTFRLELQDVKKISA